MDFIRKRLYTKKARNVAHLVVAAANILLMVMVLDGTVAVYEVEFAATFGGTRAQMTLSRHAMEYVSVVDIPSTEVGSYSKFVSNGFRDDTFQDWHTDIDCDAPGYVAAQSRLPVGVYGELSEDEYSCTDVPTLLQFVTVAILVFSGMLALSVMLSAVLDHFDEAEPPSTSLADWRVFQRGFVGATGVSQAAATIGVAVLLAMYSKDDDSHVIRAIATMGGDSTHTETEGLAMHFIYIAYGLILGVLLAQIGRLVIATQQKKGYSYDSVYAGFM